MANLARVALALACGCGRIGFSPASGDAGDAGDAGSGYEGDVLFVELFDDADFAARGWYDSPGGAISTLEHAPGSTGSLECAFAANAMACAAGGPQRHALPPVEALYFSFWAKSADVGAVLAIAEWIDSDDDIFVGPFSSEMTAVFGTSANGVAAVLMSDSANVDTACVQQSDGTVVGCGGDFATYTFGEARAICGCNGVPGDVMDWGCAPETGLLPYSNQITSAASTLSFDAAWHFVEGYLKMNSIAAGVGQRDGVMRYWVDGSLVMTADNALFRTGAHPTLAWGQLFFSPYINTGSPIAQTIWLDDLTVARGR